MNVKCALGCGRPLNPHDVGVWKQVTGFVGGPKKDSMALREDTGQYAHDSCVHKAKSGQAPDQVDLFEEAAREAAGSKPCSACGHSLNTCQQQGAFGACCVHCEQTDRRSHGA